MYKRGLSAPSVKTVSFSTEIAAVEMRMTQKAVVAPGVETRTQGQIKAQNASALQ
jgi:hypothetical protein